MRQIWKTIKEHKIISILLVLMTFVGTNPVDMLQDFDYLKNKIQEQYDMKIELIHTSKNIHVNTATSRKNPYVSSIGSWYKFRLTNTGQKAYAIVKTIYEKKQEISSFQKYYMKGGSIYLANELKLPKQIQPNESIEMYVFIPFEINREVGGKLFSLLYYEDKKIDTLVELYLFGKSPMTQKGKVPIYDHGGNLVRVMEVDIQVLNWDEYLAPRELFKNMDFEKNKMLFDDGLHDGFKYMSKHKLVASMIESEIEMKQYKIMCEEFRQDSFVTLSFITNVDKNFTKKSYVDSTCLQLGSRSN